MPDPAFPGPYTDLGITVRNPSKVDIPTVPAIIHDPTVTTVYDVAGTVKSGFSHAAAPAYSPNSWATGRDPYKTDGMVGQTYFNNPG